MDFPLRPTPKQRDVARRLGIESDITINMSREDVWRLISQARSDRRAIRRERDSSAFKQLVAKRKKALDELLRQGLCVGAEVCNEYGSQSIVKAIDEGKGTILCFLRYGSSAVVDARYIQIVALPTDDPDTWCPAGYLKIGPQLAQRAKGGEFGQNIQDQVVCRDLFLKKCTLWFLPANLAREISGRRTAREQELATQAHRIIMDRAFCADCGNGMAKPPEMPIQQWKGIWWCPTCQGRTKERLLDQRHCRRCGTLFYRGNTSKARWSSMRLCQNCNCR